MDAGDTVCAVGETIPRQLGWEGNASPSPGTGALSETGVADEPTGTPTDTAQDIPAQRSEINNSASGIGFYPWHAAAQRRIACWC
jgi:hypothetical protein